MNQANEPSFESSGQIFTGQAESYDLDLVNNPDLPLSSQRHMRLLVTSLYVHFSGRIGTLPLRCRIAQKAAGAW